MRSRESLIAQASGGEELPAARIRYSRKYAEALARMFALTTGEQSAWDVGAAREAARDVIAECNGHYTAWLVRLQCALQQRTREAALEELCLAAEVADSNTKCYQLWNHRQQVASALLSDDLSELLSLELAFTESALHSDSKHFHAWSHRIWARRLSRSWKSELTFIDSLLADDPFNNSAWNARFAAVTEGDDLRSCFQRELNVVSRCIHQNPDNEAAWNYARAICSDRHGLPRDEHLEHLARALLPCRLALRTLGAVLSQRKAIASLREACQIYDYLATFDGSKANFWTFKRRVAEQALTNLLHSIYQDSLEPL